MRKFCECGCGQKIKIYRSFVWGHHVRGKNHPRGMLGKHHSEVSKGKISLAAQNNSNYGMSNKYHTEETKRKISEANKGKKHTEETKIKMSKSHKGKILNKPAWNKGKSNVYTEETKIKMSKAAKLNWQNLAIRKKIIKAIMKVWQNLEFKNKAVKATMLGNSIKPNKPELQLQSLLSNLYPNDWQYVGDGKVILGGFCPDFINVNGKKQIIEMNGDYWHNREGAAEKDKRKIEAYKQLGYKTLTVWEHELKDTKRLENKIHKFMQKGGDAKCLHI